MQTGAFVQLIILFVAISSRMSVLSSQLEEALQLGISACNRLLVIIHVSTSSAADEHSLTDSQPTGTHATISQQLPSELETLRPLPVDHDILSEDTGQPLSRCEPIDTSTSVVEDLSMKMEVALEMRVTPPPGQPMDDDMSNFFY